MIFTLSACSGGRVGAGVGVSAGEGTVVGVSVGCIFIGVVAVGSDLVGDLDNSASVSVDDSLALSTDLPEPMRPLQAKQIKQTDNNPQLAIVSLPIVVFKKSVTGCIAFSLVTKNTFLEYWCLTNLPFKISLRHQVIFHRHNLILSAR